MRPDAPQSRLTPECARALLDCLCVKYGFCLTPLWYARLRDNPPPSADKFTRTVFLAEGLDPDTADGAMFKAMLDEVRLAFAQGAGPPRR